MINPNLIKTGSKSSIIFGKRELMTELTESFMIISWKDDTNSKFTFPCESVFKARFFFPCLESY